MHDKDEVIIAGHQPHYLPWIGYFSKIYLSDKFCLVDSIQYNKKWFQNRTKILTPNGPAWLTVPVKTKGKFHQNIGDVAINNQVPWKRKHWKSLKFSYGSSPYFSEYKDFFEDVYERDWDNLVDLSEHIIKGVLGFLDIKKEIVISSNLGTRGNKTDLLIDICTKSCSDGYLSGGGAAREYVELEKFEKAKLKHYFQKFDHPTYKQTCGQEFVPRMSIIDLLFNCGPESVKYVKGSGERTI